MHFKQVFASALFLAGVSMASASTIVDSPGQTLRYIEDTIFVAPFPSVAG